MAYRRRRRSSTAWRLRRKRYRSNYRTERRRRGRVVTRKTYRGTLTYRKLNIGSFPRVKTVYLRYVENFTLNPSAAPGSVAAVYRSNNIFDPTYATGGHQPMYYDNYAAIYTTYQVMKASCRFVILDNHVVNAAIPFNSSGTTTGATQYFVNNERAARMFVINEQSPTDYPTDINTLIEEGSKNIKWKYAPQNTSQYVQSLNTSVWPHRLANVSYKDDTLKSVGGVEPVVKTYFICGLDSFPGTDTATMNCQIIITYKVQFSDLITNQTQN